MKWEDYAVEFKWDGSLRDIYVLETSISDWQKLFVFLRWSVYKFSYQVDELEELPSSLEIFSGKREYKGLLCVEVGDVGLNCHFFSPDEIEFDFSPDEIKSEAHAKSVFDFMSQLGRALNKEVVLTPENISEHPIFKFSPVTQKVEYFPVMVDLLGPNFWRE